MAYAEEVHHAMIAWLQIIDEGALDIVPNAYDLLKEFPEYQKPGYLAEVTDLFQMPIWALLMRPCMGHRHRHLGEIEITKDILRKSC